MGSFTQWLAGTQRTANGRYKWDQQQRGSFGASHVRNPSEVVGVVSIHEFADIVSGTKQTITLSTPAKRISIRYLDIASAVGNYLYVVFGAVDDTDADTKLAAASSVRRVVSIVQNYPDVWTWDANGPMRIDIISDDAAPAGGTSLTYVEVTR